jgi:hypothetical protein
MEISDEDCKMRGKYDKDLLPKPITLVRKLPRGRTMYYDPHDNIVVVIDSMHKDVGTMFRPDNGINFILNAK